MVPSRLACRFVITIVRQGGARDVFVVGDETLDRVLYSRDWSAFENFFSVDSRNVRIVHVSSQCVLRECQIHAGHRMPD